MLASKPALFFKSDNINHEIKLEGPGEIEPFGSAEFLLKSSESIKIETKPTLAQLRLTCSNCP